VLDRVALLELVLWLVLAEAFGFAVEQFGDAVPGDFGWAVIDFDKDEPCEQPEVFQTVIPVVQ
jgi:hypothetical protein